MSSSSEGFSVEPWDVSEAASWPSLFIIYEAPVRRTTGAFLRAQLTGIKAFLSLTVSPENDAKVFDSNGGLHAPSIQTRTLVVAHKTLTSSPDTKWACGAGTMFQHRVVGSGIRYDATTGLWIPTGCQMVRAFTNVADSVSVPVIRFPADEFPELWDMAKKSNAGSQVGKNQRPVVDMDTFESFCDSHYSKTESSSS